MTTRKLFLWLSAASGYLGIGMLLGYAFSDQTKNTALWLGILLVLLGALLLGMFVSAKRDRAATLDENTGPEASSSGNITDLPRKRDD